MSNDAPAYPGYYHAPHHHRYEELGVKRIVTLDSIGVGNSWSYAPWYMRWMITLTNFKLVLADHNQQRTLPRQSGLDWVIAQLVALTNKDQVGQLLGEYEHTASSFAISRQRLARFMVDSLRSEIYVHLAPLLAEKP